MEIKTSEEYLIRENEQLQAKNENLQVKIAELKLQRDIAIDECNKAIFEKDFIRCRFENDYDYKNIKKEIKNGTPLLLCEAYHLRSFKWLVEKHGYEKVYNQFKYELELEAKEEQETESNEVNE